MPADLGSKKIGNKKMFDLKSRFSTAYSSGFKRYFANTSWMMGEKVIRMVVALFVGIYVARYLGPERFGLLSYAMSFVGLFATISTLGLDSIVVRELVKISEKQDELLGTAFALKILGSILALGVLTVAIRFTNNDRFANLLIFIIAAGMVFQSFNVIDFYFQSRVLSKYVVFAQLAQTVISSILKLVFVAIEAPLLWFAVVVLIDSIVLALGLAAMYIYNKQRIWKWRARLGVGKTLLKNSWPLILSGMVIAIYMKIDQVMIKEMLDASEVGIYAAAARLSEAWYFLPMVICSSLFPAIINAKQKSEALYYKQLQQLYDLMVWLAVAVALPTTFLAPWVIRVLYGDVFLPAAGVLSIHIWAGVFVFLGVANGRWIIAENVQQIATIRSAAGAMVNVALNIVLIPKYGINGAAIATFFSVFIASHIAFLFINKARRVFIMQNRSFFKPVLWMVGK